VWWWWGGGVFGQSFGVNTFNKNAPPQERSNIRTVALSCAWNQCLSGYMFTALVKTAYQFRIYWFSGFSVYTGLTDLGAISYVFLHVIIDMENINNPSPGSPPQELSNIVDFTGFNFIDNERWPCPVHCMGTIAMDRTGPLKIMS